MSFIINQYKKNLLIRYDFDPAIPYYEASDFKGLVEKEDTFKNNKYADIHYFFYYYEPVKFKKIILFLPGIGPGHRAYLREINELAKRGYKVLTLDYHGTGDSKGSRLLSINQPTSDVIHLLNHLKLKEEIVVIGHSLGAYTALNVINKVNTIKKAVIISGFTSVKDGMRTFVPSRFVASKIEKYEKQISEYNSINNYEYLKHTSDDILFIHSLDDPTVKYKVCIKKLTKLDNTHLSFYIVNHKHHNPLYTEEAVKYKDEIIDTYFDKLRKNKFKSLEERKEYFKDVNIDDLTAKDEIVINKISNFIG